MEKEFNGIYEHGYGESWKDVLVYGKGAGRVRL